MSILWRNWQSEERYHRWIRIFCSARDHNAEFGVDLLSRRIDPLLALHLLKSFAVAFNIRSSHCYYLFFYIFLEGVGKSSLISTFVSRHFSEVVPGIMTRVRLPPDPESSCITTIVDSQGGDAALISAITALSLSRTNSSSSLSSLQKSLSYSTSTSIGGIENVDSIVLIYDLDRVDTFFRLENHWLPLIERCYNGAVSFSTSLFCICCLCAIVF
jgi:hypothetical protein